MAIAIPITRRLSRWRWRALALYAILLLASYVVRAFLQEGDALPPGDSRARVQAVEGDRHTSATVQVAYREYGFKNSETDTPIVLLHGSPGRKEDFRGLAPILAAHHRVITVDLPGFGLSSRHIPDYSFRAHADYVLQLMDGLGIARAHIVGFSMGGGVALSLIDRAPERVASLTMLSAIGVQEMELLGSYPLNHALHGLLLAGAWTLDYGIPDFGLNRRLFAVSFARNFFDSDQRPLRGILGRVECPTLILHGADDPLVPVAAAHEHHRLVPQSELREFDNNHFMVFQEPSTLAFPLLDFIGRVERGSAQTRARADAARLARSGEPFDAADLPHATGIAALILICLIAISTFVSEDLTCIGAGVMVAQGRIAFLPGAFACFLGIFAGDLLLYFAGRYLGRPALLRRPLRWFIKNEDVERASAWFSRRGIPVILSSRFVPGSRLPTYFAAGVLNTRFWWFATYFLAAGVVWAPLLVGLSRYLGAGVIESSLLAGQSLVIKIILAAGIILAVARTTLGVSTRRGRRMMLSRWRRLTRWEFWPAWVFYPPVVAYVVYLAIRYRSLTVFTAANPGIPAGGFVGESKAQILRSLDPDLQKDSAIARAEIVPAALGSDEKMALAHRFVATNEPPYPVVVKPNEGQRGAGVVIARTEAEVDEYLVRSAFDTIVQEYVPGLEFGIFYYRRPDERQGRIFAITEKRMPHVEGDGRRTLEQLILDDDRAVCMAKFHLRRQADRLDEIIAAGESVELVELGTHCRGAVFMEGGWALTTDLEAAVDEVSKRFAGFYFGRYDVRTASPDALRAGQFKVIELNGVTSEATNIYDPRNSLFAAYGILFAQWRLAFEIGAANARRGARPATWRELLEMTRGYNRRAKLHLT